MQAGNLVRALGVAAALAVTPGAHAHEQGGSSNLPRYLDCEHPPADAATLPEPIGRWTAILCLPQGEMLVQAPDWQWRYPASFVTQVKVPARTAASLSDPSATYFTRLEAVSIEQADLAALHQRFARTVAPYGEYVAASDTQPGRLPVRGYVLRTANNHGHGFDLYFMYFSDADIWGIPCEAQCPPEAVFRVGELSAQ